MKWDAEEVIKRYNEMKSNRATYEATWQDVAKYCLPRKADIIEKRTPGQKLDYDVYDSTAIQANIVLAAGFHSYMTNPSSKWFTLRIKDPRIMQRKEVKLWLRDSEDSMYDAINASNFNQQIHEVYLDMPIFGWGCLYVTEDMRDVVRYYSRSVAEIYIDEDEAERVDTVYRKFELTARQAYRLWGKEAGKTTLELIEDDDDDSTVEFCHFVGPRADYDPGKRDSTNMPFVSMYIDVKNREIISESGYWEFPFMCPRFNKQAGELYGTGPGLVSYSDIKMLNSMDLVTIRAAQKIVDPPMVLPHDGFLLPIKQSPGAINYATRSNPNDRIDFLNSPANIPVSFEMMNARRQVIQRNFFVDLFLLMAQVPEGRMTATEVIQRNAEKMLILAPTLGRLMSELLNPVINRTFNIMLRAGVIPPAPASLRGQEYVIEYTSPLAKAQRAADLNSMSNFLGMVGQMASFVPTVLDKLNSDDIVDRQADMHNVPPSIVRSPEEVAQIRQQRAQQQAQMAQMQQLNAAAQIGKTATEGLKNYTEAEEVATNAGQPAEVA